MRPAALTDFDHAVWIQTSFLGDVVLTTGALALFRRAFPGRKQFLVTTAVGAAALKDAGVLDGIAVFDKSGLGVSGMLAVKAALRRMTAGLRAGVILQAHLSMRSALLARLLSLPVVTYRQANGSRFSIAEVERVAVLHEAARVALLLEPLGVARAEIVATMPRLIAGSAVADAGLAAFLSSESFPGVPIAAVVPGSVWATKKWPSQRFGEVAVWLLRAGWKVLVLGAANEKDDAAVIDAMVPEGLRERFMNAAGRTGVGDLPAVYPRLGLVIGNDSSSLHYASSFSVPTLAIFGSTVPAMGFAPLSPLHRVVQQPDLPCRPCSAHGPSRCPLDHFRCMLDVGTEKVETALRAMGMGQPASGRRA